MADLSPAALAQEQQGVTDEELLALKSWAGAYAYESDLVGFARAVLARWGGAAPQLVAVNERLPKPEDCDEQGRCWRWNRIQRGWLLQPLHRRLYEFEPYWLPASALPLPEAEG